MGAGCAASHGDLDSLDRWARARSPIHDLDPRAKLVAALGFVLAVVSMDKYALGELLPFFLFPVLVLARSSVPVALVAKRVLAVAPFAALVGAFNPLFDREPLLHLAGVAVPGGWVSFASILLRGLLSISALVLLVATTEIPALGQGAGKLGVPKFFVAQLLGLYRYLFLLKDEGERMMLAYRLRAPHARPPTWRVFASILGQLLLRSLKRAERVSQAMWLRGFAGEMPNLKRLVFSGRDWWFLLGWLAVFLVLRCLHPALWIGHLAFRIGA